MLQALNNVDCDDAHVSDDDVTPSETQSDLGATHTDECDGNEPSTSGRNEETVEDDRKLLTTVAELLCTKVPHPLTLEGCCNTSGTNRVFPQLDFCTPEKSFLDRDVAGHHIYLNPPFKSPLAFLRHVNECYKRAPTTTSCVAIVPRWNHGKYCSEELQGWQLLHTFPAKTKLFEQPVLGGTYVAMKATPWPVSVWYKVPMPGGASANAMRQRFPTFVCSGKLAHTPASVGIHQYEEDGQRVLHVPSDQDMKMILLDTGATDSFVNPRWLTRAGYDLGRLKPSDMKVN